jgi:choline dehydrogenase-like flavoprotein
MAKTHPEHDVIVVGSGAAGGMSAFVLAVHGVRVLMLEAGRDYDPLTETPMFNLPREAPLRGARTPDKPFGFYDATVDGGWQVPGEPYASAKGTDFRWWRARMLGGRTNHWGRISLRMGPWDFRPRSRDGLGFDWPITYDELAPYYDRTEALIGVYGSNEGLANTPDSSPGVLLPPPAPRVHELLTQKVCREKLAIPVIPAHLAILSRRQDADTWPARLFPGNPLAQRVVADSMRSRAACFWATPCGRGCSIKANFQSTTVLLPPALATGNLRIRTDAMVREVTHDARGRATGVHYVDRITGREEHARAKLVVLAASACESARILLNSRSTLFPHGLGNGSGLVGRYIMDTVGSDVSGQIPALESLPPHNQDGASAMHMYMPWWLYDAQARGRMDFARGYHIEFGGGRGMPGPGMFAGLSRLTGGAYGTQLREDLRRYYGSVLGFAGRGEMIPNADCFCEIDPSGAKDRWGIPTLKFHWKWSEHELNQALHMQRTFRGIVEAMGGRVLSPPVASAQEAIDPPGYIIHEVGGAMMGNDPARSVLNGFCQSHEVPNLFVTDGAGFVSNADKNPTLSILAIAWRACDYIVQNMRKGVFA